MTQNSFFICIYKFYEWFIRFFSNWQSVFLFLLRITWGHQFFLAGLGKIHKMDGTIMFFEGLGIPLPAAAAWLVALTEMIGGLSLFFGFASRLFAFLLSVVMFVAYSTAHVHIFSKFAFVFDPSLLVKEAPFPFLLTSLTILIFGPGKISIDGWIKRHIQNKHYFY